MIWQSTVGRCKRRTSWLRSKSAWTATNAVSLRTQCASRESAPTYKYRCAGIEKRVRTANVQEESPHLHTSISMVLQKRIRTARRESARRDKSPFAIRKRRAHRSEQIRADQSRSEQIKGEGEERREDMRRAEQKGEQSRGGYEKSRAERRAEQSRAEAKRREERRGEESRAEQSRGEERGGEESTPM